MRHIIIMLFAVLSVNAHAAIDWNEPEIKWYGYVDGLMAAKAQRKNVILVVYAEWCGVCKKYSKMFKDKRVVSRSDNVVLIKLDQDKDIKYLKKYSIDGSYVPRTYLLNRDLGIMDSPYKSKKYQFYLPPGNAKYFSNLLDELR